MSMPEAIYYDPRSVPLPTRLAARTAVAAARLLARRPPRQIRRVLTRLRRGAVPSTREEVLAARQAVTAVSLVCAAREGCLPRSLAVALLCRMRGGWAAWCVGTRRLPPFAAHAWVEVDGAPVGEEFPADYFRPLFTVA
ncbi:lasso peptide biosynthesis B2 protein [Phytohabitans houttuyneae]|uniref:Microcin J25-processing protein McjB C-terminal domain-containing protein n=1 Tax=Phytohabitans houttuyneae TaxID=1076126 RepID=A0A6V8K143_9ACTN|nr:lasso peptide biosynthesis B2 protein [Phytohabitans houttuyneae]GFJ78822.1 hypothetical protein Phou_030020 [Phytohabitans houttuyneae]